MVLLELSFQCTSNKIGSKVASHLQVGHLIIEYLKMIIKTFENECHTVASNRPGSHCTAWIWIWLTKGPGATSDNVFIFRKLNTNTNRKKILWAVLEIIPVIHFYPHG